MLMYQEENLVLHDEVVYEKFVNNREILSTKHIFLLHITTCCSYSTPPPPRNYLLFRKCHQPYSLNKIVEAEDGYELSFSLRRTIDFFTSKAMLVC